MPASRRTKFIIWSFLSVVVVCAALLLPSQPSIPLTLTFHGYSSDSNGQSIASFCISNQSNEPVLYLAEGPPLPYYYYTSLQLHDAKTDWTGVTNYRTASVGAVTLTSLAPSGSIRFPVLMTAGTSDAKIGVSYVPHRLPLHARIEDAAERLRGGSHSLHFDSLELL